MLATVEKMYRVLVERGTKFIINHIKVHKTRMADCKINEQVVVLYALMTTTWQESVVSTLIDVVVNQGQTDDLVEANCKSAETICTL